MAKFKRIVQAVEIHTFFDGMHGSGNGLAI